MNKTVYLHTEIRDYSVLYILLVTTYVSKIFQMTCLEVWCIALQDFQTTKFLSPDFSCPVSHCSYSCV